MHPQGVAVTVFLSKQNTNEQKVSSLQNQQLIEKECFKKISKIQRKNICSFK